jgi:hypothetical protein
MLALMPVTGERAAEELAEVIPEGFRDSGWLSTDLDFTCHADITADADAAGRSRSYRSRDFIPVRPVRRTGI